MYEIYCKPKQHVAFKSKATGGEWLPLYKEVADANRWTVTVIAMGRAVILEKTFETEDEARRMAELLRATAFPCPEVFYPTNEPLRAAL